MINHHFLTNVLVKINVNVFRVLRGFGWQLQMRLTSLCVKHQHPPSCLQEVCRSLGAINAADAVQLCCCSDQLSDPAAYWDVTPTALSQLTSWWQHRMACTTDTCLTDDIYLDILARQVMQFPPPLPQHPLPLKTTKNNFFFKRVKSCM